MGEQALLRDAGGSPELQAVAQTLGLGNRLARQHWPLESITRVRWGGVLDQAANASKFTLFFASAAAQAELHFFEESVFSPLTGKLWLALGQRLVTQMIAELGKGARLSFGDAVVDDAGIRLCRHQSPGDTARVRGAWAHLHRESSNGTLLIRHKDEYAAYAALPYHSVDNFHVLSAAIRTLLETKTPILMSDLLQP